MEKIQEVGNLSINIFFAALMGLITLNVVALCLYCCCNEACQCMRFLSHLSWCIIAIIMLLSFLLGGLLGSAGLLFTDGSGFMSYLFSEQNLKFDKILLTGDVATYVNICFNGNITIYKIYNR